MAISREAFERFRPVVDERIKAVAAQARGERFRDLHRVFTGQSEDATWFPLLDDSTWTKINRAAIEREREVSSNLTHCGLGDTASRGLGLTVIFLGDKNFDEVIRDRFSVNNAHPLEAHLEEVAMSDEDPEFVLSGLYLPDGFFRVAFNTYGVADQVRIYKHAIENVDPHTGAPYFLPDVNSPNTALSAHFIHSVMDRSGAYWVGPSDWSDIK